MVHTTATDTHVNSESTRVVTPAPAFSLSPLSLQASAAAKDGRAVTMVWLPRRAARICRGTWFGWIVSSTGST
jgi:hypothetical protein